MANPHPTPDAVGYDPTPVPARMGAMTTGAVVIGTTGKLVHVHSRSRSSSDDLVSFREDVSCFWAKETRVRVRSALLAVDVTVAASAEVEGPTDPALDLAVAVALTGRQTSALLIGELSLAGEIRPVRGVLPALLAAQEAGMELAIIPESCAPEVMPGVALRVCTARTLRDVLQHLDNPASCLPVVEPTTHQSNAQVDMSEIRGHYAARRAMEVAAIGGHHVLLMSPAGAGKTMLARRFPGLLPAPTQHEALEIAAIYSAAGLNRYGGLGERPFRAPHYTASAAAMIGGGRTLRPGEVTLAHGGVLFLDELPEFRRDVIETLRTVMEQGEIVVARDNARVRMPASPQVVAAMNPCPCGQGPRSCSCTPKQIERYRRRIHPLLSTIDIRVRLSTQELTPTPGECSADIAARVAEARSRTNVALANSCETDPTLRVDQRAERARRVAATIAHMAGMEYPTHDHMAEAMTLTEDV